MYKTNKSRENYQGSYSFLQNGCKFGTGPKKNSSASRSGGRKPVKVSNDHCRICNSSFALMGTKCSNENLFLPSGRKECAGCVLADTSFIVGVKLVQDPGKSDKVCRPCARKIRNAADCFTFITGKLTENDAEPKGQQTTGLEENSSTPSIRQNRSRQVQVQSDRKDCCRQQ